MNKRLRVPLLLLVILLALGGLAKWDEWKTGKETAADKAKGKIVELKPEDVTAVDYATVGTDAAPPTDAKGEPTETRIVPLSATIIRQGDLWQLSKPIAAPADAAAVVGLIKAVTDYSYASVVTESKDKWADFGLVTPQRTISLTYAKDGKPEIFTVYVGGKAPVGYSVYLRTSAGGDKVFMGGQHLLLSSAKTLNDFRDKSVVKVDEKSVKTLTYAARNQPAIVVEKQADGHYKITRPEALEADDNEVRDFFDGLNQLRAESFVDAPQADETIAFNSPDYAITWTDDKGAATTLKLLDKGNKIGAALDPKQRLFLLADDQRPKVKKELINFRNRRVLQIDSINLSKVDVDGDKFVNVDGTWYTPEDATKLKEKDKPAEQAHLRAFVVDLEFARADQFLPPTDAAAKALTSPPEHRITLSFKDPAKSPDVVLDTFPVPGQTEKLYVKRSGTDKLYRVNKSVFNSMKASKKTADPAAPEPAPSLNGTPTSDEEVPDEELPPDLSKAQDPKENKG